MDGYKILDIIKKNSDFKNIPVIMLTAKSEEDDRVRGLEAGADDFVTKPVNDAALFCRLKSLVRLKMLIDELRGRGAKVVVCSHLGRPKGNDPAFSMAPVAARMGEIGGFAVVAAPVGQFGLVVKQVQLRRPARLAEIDHAPRAGSFPVRGFACA